MARCRSRVQWADRPCSWPSSLADSGIAPVSGLLRIVLAEDSVLLREGLIRLLQEAGHTIVAAIDNALELVPAVIEHRPDLAVVDVRMPPTFTDAGLRAAVEARRVPTGLRVLV